MRFLPKDLCEKALAIGCKSNSGFVYSRSAVNLLTDPPQECWVIQYQAVAQGRVLYRKEADIHAFCFEDFAGNAEQARKNARLVFGVGHMDCERAHLCPTCLSYSDMAGIKKRHYYTADMLQSSDWIEFIRPHIEQAYSAQSAVREQSEHEERMEK